MASLLKTLWNNVRSNFAKWGTALAILAVISLLVYVLNLPAPVSRGKLNIIVSGDAIVTMTLQEPSTGEKVEQFVVKGVKRFEKYPEVEAEISLKWNSILPGQLTKITINEEELNGAMGEWSFKMEQKTGCFITSLGV